MSVENLREKLYQARDTSSLLPLLKNLSLEDRRSAREALLQVLEDNCQDLPKGKELKRVRQDRGYQFEKLICCLLGLEGLNPAPPMRPKGEQIDGAFELEGRYFLFEAKWQGGKTPASDVFAFKGKVDGKLVGTVGVFLSRQFSSDAALALSTGKVANIILFNENDVRVAVEHSFVDVLRMKLRRAAQYGQIYYDVTASRDEQAVP